MSLQDATLENFNEVAYLLANPDVASAVMNGQFASAYLHLLHFGLKEGRQQFKAERTQSELDAHSLASDVPQSRLAAHRNMQNLVHSLLAPGITVLEVGSRCVTSESMWLREACAGIGAEYVGFDYYAGRNVDVVGDAHQLQRYIGRQFDLVYSSAVFEHLAMPWLVSQQMVGCLKPGGYVLVETHFSFSSHERPWHFFQFSDMALKVLFPRAMGIECIEAGVSNPIVGRFSALADDYLKHVPVNHLYCHSGFYGRKVEEVTNFCWADVDLPALVGETKYPRRV